MVWGRPPRRGAVVRILAQVYPNNEMRLRVVTRPPDKARECDRDRNLTLTANSENRHSRSRRSIVHEGQTYYPGYGMSPRKTRFTIRAARTILRVGGVMDGLKGWNTCITLTLPANHVAAYYTLADYSSYCVDAFKCWVRDQVRDSEALRYFYVWELQKRGALHLHLCVNAPDYSVLERLRLGSKNAWIRILQRVEIRSGCNLFRGKNNRDWRYFPEKIQVDVQVVRLSVAAYFAKYCSKDKQAFNSGLAGQIYPVRWWGCSRRVLSELRDSTQSFLSPVMHPSQAMGLMSSIVRDFQSLGSRVHLFRERFTKYNQVVSYCRPGLLGEVRERVGQAFEELKVCKYRGVALSMEYRQARRGLRQKWQTNRGRIDLWEVFSKDRHAWAALTLWFADNSSVDRDFVVALWNRYLSREGLEPDEGGGPVQQCIFGPNFW